MIKHTMMANGEKEESGCGDVIAAEGTCGVHQYNGDIVETDVIR